MGANEYIMDVTHEVPGPDGALVPAVDFMALVDTLYTSELNMWYHTLNVGFRTRASGETDFPCVSGRPGRAGTIVREAGRPAELRGLVRGDPAGPRVRERRPEPPARAPRERRRAGRARQRAPAGQGGHTCG